MSTARHVLKQKLANRERVMGVGVIYPSPGLAEHLASSGFDLVFIDCEHGGPGVERVADMARAIRAGGGASVLRPWSRDPGLVRRYLECGIDGLVAPEIGNAADAQAMVDAIVACDPPGADDIVLLTLIETVEGMRNLDSILAVPRVDGMQVGPGDLAVSMGLPRRGKHPEVTATSLGLMRRATELGRSGGGPLHRFGADALREVGANVLMVNVDELLKAGIDALRAGLGGART
jgi:2-keto-3-deoxy-L-rhamnonate aldolase RhmA